VKRSEIYRMAAEGVSEGNGGMFYGHITGDRPYIADMRPHVMTYFPDDEDAHPNRGFTQDEKVLAFCFMAAIAESEEK
jgi:hypothetical protein